MEETQTAATDQASEAHDDSVRSETHEQKQEDVSGLKSALEKERAAVREARAKLKQLQEQVSEIESLKKRSAEMAQELEGFRTASKRSELIRAAVEKAAKEGKQVDASKVERLAARFSADGLEEALAEVVELVAVPAEKAAPAPKPERAIKGQPAKEPATVTDGTPLARLYRENPEAYAAAREERRRANPYL